MTSISIIKNHVDVVGTTSIKEVIQSIKDPESPLRPVIEEIRQLYLTGSGSTANELKKSLSGFTCSGIFKKRRVTKNLDSYSGTLILDLDKLQPQQVQHTKAIIEGMPYTNACFISPSGMGLKVVVRVDSGADIHKAAYEQVKRLYEEETGEQFDKTSDLARLTYMSFDQEAYYNEGSAVYKVDQSQMRRASVIPLKAGTTEKLNMKEQTTAFKKAIAFTEKSLKFEEGSRNPFIFQLACNGNRQGIALDEMLNLCMERYAEGWDEKELQTTIIGAYNRNPDQVGIWRSLPFVSDSRQFSNKHLGKEASGNGEVKNDLENSPLIPEEIIKGMPAIISNIANMLTSERERDTFVTGALTVLSGCLNGIKGVYDGSVFYPNLFCFIIAPAASGKGVLKLARDLGGNLNTKMKKQSEESEKNYQRQLEEYAEAKKKGQGEFQKPDPPPFKLLFVPGNSSSASIIDHLNESGGIGIVCETEADTVAYCMKNDWGNYSDVMRKAYHHETISSGRKTTGKRNIEILNPRLSVALSGTVSQVNGLIPSAEDGLFSRFIYYQFATGRKWRDVSPANGKGDMPGIVAAKAQEVTAMVEFLNENTSEFELTEQQWKKLNTYFDSMLTEVSCFVTEEASASVMRCGSITFRIAMILSAIKKYEDRSKSWRVVCTDDHFEMAIGLVSVYLQHALLLYKQLPAKDSRQEVDGKRKRFLDILPIQFTREEGIAVTKSTGLNVSESWIDRWLGRFVKYGYLVKPEYSVYRKVQAGTAEMFGSVVDMLVVKNEKVA